MAAIQIKAEVVRKERLSNDIVRLTFNAPEIAANAHPGQFLMLKAATGLEPLLRRPFSIHQVTAGGQVQILLRVVGKGSRFLAEREKGDQLDIVGPLGHGFILPDSQIERIGIVGGGIGCAPLYYLVKTLLRERQNLKMQVFLGALTASDIRVVNDDFEDLGIEVFPATDDGSLGYHGYVTDLLSKSLDRSGKWQIYSCGPHPMMSKVASLCAAEKWACQVSLETMMACGISACLGCTIRSSLAMATTSNRPFLHVCKDGPVFDAGDVAWGEK